MYAGRHRKGISEASRAGSSSNALVEICSGQKSYRRRRQRGSATQRWCVTSLLGQLLSPYTALSYCQSQMSWARPWCDWRACRQMLRPVRDLRMMPSCRILSLGEHAVCISDLCPQRLLGSPALMSVLCRVPIFFVVSQASLICTLTHPMLSIMILLAGPGAGHVVLLYESVRCGAEAMLKRWTGRHR